MAIIEYDILKCRPIEPQAGKREKKRENYMIPDVRNSRKDS